MQWTKHNFKGGQSKAPATRINPYADFEAHVGFHQKAGDAQ